jgi:hypothetical protein
MFSTRLLSRAGACGAILGVIWGAGRANAGDHLLISEFAVLPTDAEFIEIYNPTSVAIDLSDYYVTDFVFKLPGETDNPINYWHNCFPTRTSPMIFWHGFRPPRRFCRGRPL